MEYKRNMFGHYIKDETKLPEKFEAVVGIVEFKGRIFVAKQCGVYVLGEDDVLRPVEFAGE